MPLQRFRSLVANGDLQLDRHQEAAAARLDRLARELEAAPAPASTSGGFLARLGFGRDPAPASAASPKGVYLHGDVGRGKSMLMDLFAAAVRDVPRRRVHFHEFMLEVQRRLHGLREAGSEDDPLHALAADLAKE